MNMTTKTSLLGVLLTLFCAFSSQAQAIDAKEVMVIYNTAFKGSEEIATAYSEARAIPSEHLLAISTSVGEEITRQTYNEEIKAPISEFLAKNAKVRVVVTCRGVPLKIKEDSVGDEKGPLDGQDFAAVDSELSTLRLASKPLGKAFANPSFNKAENITLEDKVIIVCRLDGPTHEVALGLIEKAIMAEAFGTSGESVLDTGPAKAAYAERDTLMNKIAGTWKDAKIPFYHDSQPTVYDLSIHKESPLHYNGWYAGSPAKWKKPIQFRTGSIAVHLHSFSAATLRDVKKNWCAPLLNWGATATIGTVYEPYTIGFPQESIYWDRLTKGYSFGEAGMIANQHLSWQAIFVGDPLYTPYAKDAKAKRSKRRKGVLEMFDAKADKAEAIAGGDTTLLAAYRFLRARIEAVNEASKKDQKLSSKLFGELSFLTRDMGISAALGDGAEKLNKALEKEFKAIKSQLKKRINDTEAYSKAFKSWQGLEVYEDLEKFHKSLVKDQKKACEKWLKNAKRNQKSNPYDAWKNANQASLCEYAPELAAEALKLAEEIHEDNKGQKRYLRTANKELRSILSSAKAQAKRSPEKAIEALRHAIRDYPKCAPRNNCQKELNSLRGVKPKKKPSKK